MRYFQGYADEIVVTDTGFFDRTIEIDKDLDASVKNFNWIDDLAVSYNYATDLATSNWTFWIDADEELLH